MNFNEITPGISLLGTTVKSLNVENSVVDILQDSERNFGLNINEPILDQTDSEIFAMLSIELEIEIKQSDDQNCKIEFALGGAFLSEEDADLEEFKGLVAINGAAALVGIARGKIESISANVLNNGKILLPFINVLEYYNSDVE